MALFQPLGIGTALTYIKTGTRNILCPGAVLNRYAGRCGAALIQVNAGRGGAVMLRAKGGAMPVSEEPATQPGEEAALAAALREAPRGALALAGAAVALLMVAWLLIYFCVFLPRGMVG